MTDYDDGVPAMHRYAELLSTAEPTLSMLDHLLTVRRCALGPDRNLAWPESEPERLTRRYKALLARPVWRELVLAHLNNPCGTVPYGFNVALSCAGRLDMPVLPQALHHLEREPFNAYAWQWAVNHSDSETITSVVTLAMRVLPLDVLASGPANSQGFGPEHAPDRALEAIINRLDKHPGIGLELLRISLSNRVVRIRHRALRTLTTWPAESRPSQLWDWISAAAAAEPDGELQGKMQALLDNRTTP